MPRGREGPTHDLIARRGGQVPGANRKEPLFLWVAFRAALSAQEEEAVLTPYRERSKDPSDAYTRPASPHTPVDSESPARRVPREVRPIRTG